MHLRRALAVGILLAASGNAGATAVRFRLVDQDGKRIVGSNFFPGIGPFRESEVATLEPGDYVVRVRPGLAGTLQSVLLFREYTVTVAGPEQLVELVWPTALVALDLADDQGVTIPASSVMVPGTSALIPVPTNFRLPITSDPDGSAIGGLYNVGYPFELRPGVLGIAQFAELFQLEPAIPLPLAGLIRTFVWPRGQLSVRIVNGAGSAIPGSNMRLERHGPALEGPVIRVRLPVTDDPDRPTIHGSFSAGYTVEVLPGILGIRQDGRLARREQTGEMTAGGVTLDLAWEIAEGPALIVDGNESEIVGASFAIDGFIPEAYSGTSITLPVNDFGTYPTLGGSFAGAYPVSIRPGEGRSPAGPFPFALDPEGNFSPAYVVAEDGLTGLRFQACTDPTSLDGDTVADCRDNCPGVANVNQLDVDGDRRGDACDNCPALSNLDQADRDADGFGDRCDLCADAFDPAQADEDADRAGDACDNCPAHRNVGQSDIDADGEGNACDLDDGLIYVVAPARDRLEWQAEGGAVAWDLYRGDLGALRGGGDWAQLPGSNALAARRCGLTATAFTDEERPADGEAAFYLVAVAGVPGLGFDGAGAPRPNSNPCP